MGYVAKAMQREGYSKEEIDAYFDDAKSSDYNHLVSVSGEKIREINRKLRETKKKSKNICIVFSLALTLHRESRVAGL